MRLSIGRGQVRPALDTTQVMERLRERTLGQGVKPQYRLVGAPDKDDERGLRRVAYRVALWTGNVLRPTRFPKLLTRPISYVPTSYAATTRISIGP